jgi:hypothetical protein
MYNIYYLDNMFYGPIQNPKWTKKHSYILLNFLLLILTFFPVIVAMVNGMQGGFSGSVTTYGIPITWLRIGIGAYSYYEIFNFLGLLLDLSFNLVVSTIIVYLKQLIQLLSKH